MKYIQVFTWACTDQGNLRYLIRRLREEFLAVSRGISFFPGFASMFSASTPADSWS